MDIYATFKQIHLTLGFPGAAMVKKPPASAGDARDSSSVAGLRRPPGGGNGNPLLYSCLENSTEEPAAKSLQSCPTLCDPRDGSPPGSPVPGILQARTRVGCHFLLQCMKVKRESEVAQLCLTLSDPMACSLPGSSVHGIFQARVLEWGAIAFRGA